jgi:hypothetical protein
MNPNSTNQDYVCLGSACLADFLGHATPESVVSLAEVLFDVGELFKDSESEGGGASKFIDLDTYLGFVCKSIRTDGWMSRGATRETGGQSTADLADLMMSEYFKDLLNPYLKPSEADFARAEAAKAFLGTYLITHSEDNDYVHNLSVLLKTSVISWKMMGIAASIIVTAEKEMGKEIERRQFANLHLTSRHLGEVGAKLTVKATVSAVKELETQFGITTLIKFISDGSALTWFASGNKSEEFEVGAEVMIVGKVKAFDIYQGVKGTVLTRVNVVTQEIIDAEEAKAAKKAAKLAKKLAVVAG